MGPGQRQLRRERRGRFPKAEQGSRFTLESITVASSPGRDRSGRQHTGRLQVGIDVAGGEASSDEDRLRRAAAGSAASSSTRSAGSHRTRSRAHAQNIARYRKPGDDQPDSTRSSSSTATASWAPASSTGSDTYARRDEWTGKEIRCIGFPGWPATADARPAGPVQAGATSCSAGLVEHIAEGELHPIRLAARGRAPRLAVEARGPPIGSFEHKSAIKDQIGRSPRPPRCLRSPPPTWVPEGPALG